MPFDLETARAHADRVAPTDPARIRDDIVELARPRLSGSEEAAAVEETIRSRFADLGYDCRELDFSFSTWPGRYGIAVAGGVLAVAAAVGGWWTYAGRPALAVAVLAVGLALSLLPLVLLDRALFALPWGRLETSNLLFTRGRPAWLVMAHRDSKSQAVPTLLRTLALGAAAAGWLALVVLAGLWLVGGALRWPGAVAVATAVTIVAGLVLAISRAGNASPGALDNASGLAALLEVARRTDDPRVGFLVTDGEELGLAGARAAVGHTPPVQGVINVDGLDDRGATWIAEGHGWRRRGSAPQLAAALLAAARALDVDVRRRPLPRSVPVDHVPIAAAGVPALTVLRGRWSSLLRVHRPGDHASRMDGGGAAETATLLTVALRLLGETEADRLAGPRRRGHSPAP